MSPDACSAADVLEMIGSEQIVRDYLRGVEEGSETDRDAQRSMLSAIERMRAADVRDVMARKWPNLYAQACLLLCGMWTDAATSDAETIRRQAAGIMMQLRYDPDNVADAAK